jgi:mannose-6-phosphate isomerase class I
MLIEQSIQRLAVAASDCPQKIHLVIQFSHTQHYLPEQPKLELLALVSLNKHSAATTLIEGSIFPFAPELFERLRLLSDDLSDDSCDTSGLLRGYCQDHSLPWLVMSDPWLLLPIHIPKPWGQEIWYTGIEARGQAEVMGDIGNIPLPWLLELMAGRTGLRGECQPILLKVLDPLPDEVYGDLYFELHQEKQEVYVVTHIDPQAWPEAIGAIQLGFAAQARQRYKTDGEFKQAYLNSVTAYEQIRRLLDSKLDEKKAAAGIQAHQSATAAQLMYWTGVLAQESENRELIDKEIELRNAMNSFVQKYPLTVGDVVTVPKLVPHALQHGVRVIEFQTPVYERKILSFGQKVLTQAHWDTQEALELADLGVVGLQPSELMIDTPQLRIERIVNFDDFEVRRIQLEGHHTFNRDLYCVVMVLQGRLTLGCAERMRTLASGQAVLLPKNEKGWLAASDSPCVFLLASPRQLA